MPTLTASIREPTRDLPVRHQADILVVGERDRGGGGGSRRCTSRRGRIADRGISADHQVHHATKEIPACMATGEAAGVAAALSLERGVDPGDISVSELRARLQAEGAIVCRGSRSLAGPA